MKHFIDALKQFRNFRDRATRTQFWMFYLVYTLLCLAAALIDVFSGMPWLGLFTVLVLMIPSLAIGARRLHDIGRSGWRQLLMLVPFLSLLVLVLWTFKSKGDNQYGPATLPASG